MKDIKIDGMKGMKYNLKWIALAFCLFCVACDDDDEGTTTVVFPGLQKLECAVGEQKTLTFETAGNWTLTSSALWCSFLVNNEKVYSCSGAAGKQNVTLCVDDDASELLKSYQAELTLITEGQRQVIYTVTRPTTGYELHAYTTDLSVEYNAENPFVEDYDGNQKMVVVANFDWYVETVEGLTLNKVSGLAGEEITLKPSLAKGYTKNAWQANLHFKNKKEEVVAQLPVKYEGIPADRIEFSNENPLGTTITFSVYGDTYTIGEEEFSGAMSIAVTAREDKYTIVYVDYKEERNEDYEYEYQFELMTEDNTWFWVDSDDHAGNITLAAGYNNNNKQTGYLMIFPDAKYNEIKDNFENEVFSIKGINDAYDGYIAARLEQTANPKFTTGFTLTDGAGEPLTDEYGDPVTVMSYTDAVGSEDEALAKYGTTNVHLLSLPLSKDYAEVLIKPNGYTGYYLQAGTMFEGQETIWEGVSLNPLMLDATLCGLNANVKGDKEIVVTFMDPNGNMYAVLLVSRY